MDVPVLGICKNVIFSGRVRFDQSEPVGATDDGSIFVAGAFVIVELLIYFSVVAKEPLDLTLWKEDCDDPTATCGWPTPEIPPKWAVVIATKARNATTSCMGGVPSPPNATLCFSAQ
jgi:hypothetical protein